MEPKRPPENIAWPHKLKLLSSVYIRQRDVEEPGWIIVKAEGGNYIVQKKDNEMVFTNHIPMNQLEGLQDEIKKRLARVDAKIQPVTEFDELYKNLRELGGLQTSQGYFDAEVLVDIIEKKRKGKLKEIKLTSTGGLNKKVDELVAKESIK